MKKYYENPEIVKPGVEASYQLGEAFICDRRIAGEYFYVEYPYQDNFYLIHYGAKEFYTEKEAVQFLASLGFTRERKN